MSLRIGAGVSRFKVSLEASQLYPETANLSALQLAKAGAILHRLNDLSNQVYDSKVDFGTGTSAAKWGIFIAIAWVTKVGGRGLDLFFLCTIEVQLEFVSGLFLKTSSVCVEIVV